ncbi:MAG: MBL fold metallo-hydrolase [Candidatus Thorarchaeota archaeon]
MGLILLNEYKAKRQLVIEALCGVSGISKWPEIRFLRQSGFYIRFRARSLLIDPSNRKSGDYDGDVVYCTHKHSDHTGGVGNFLMRNPEALLVGNRQVIDALGEWRERAVEARLGEELNFDEFSLEFVECEHGLFRGVVVYGVIVKSDGFTFGHCGDSVNLERFGDKDLDMFALPISGIVAASPNSAIEQLAKFKTPLPTIIPMHWLFRRPKSFCKQFQNKFPGGKCIIPEEGTIIPG